MIMSGVTIGDGAVVGAGSVVTKNIPPYSVWGGAPIRYIKHRFDNGVIEKLLKIKWWDWSEKKIREYAPILMSKDVEKIIEIGLAK